MNAVLLLGLGLGLGLVLGGARAPGGAAGRVVALEAGRRYRLRLVSTSRLDRPEAETDVRFELLSLSAFDIAFEPHAVEFSIVPAAPKTLTLGSPLSSSLGGSSLVLESVERL